MNFRHAINLTMIFLIMIIIPCFAITLDQAVNEAETKQKAGDLEGAIEALQNVEEESKYNPTYIAYLGYYKGQMAGQAKDMMKAAQLSGDAFQLLGKAIAMDSAHVKARLFRGTLSMFMPDFMGKTDDGIQDLNVIINTFQSLPGMVSPQDAGQAISMLIIAYDKKNDPDMANWMRKQMILMAPGSPPAQQAETYLKENNIDVDAIQPPAGLQSSKPIDASVVKKQAQSLIAEEKYAEVVPILKTLVNAGQADQEAFEMLMHALSETSQGYDASISENTDNRTNMAFDVINMLDKAVQAFPDNLDWLLERGSVCVMMPYFVNRLDSGMEDLQTVAEKTDSDSIKAEALYWLGFAYQKKGQSQWYEVATKLSKQPAFKRILNSTKPNIQRLDIDKLEKPAVTVEFTIAFQDQLAPQTAVWVEDAKGQYVKTLFVSGFSGFVKDKQVVLPKWARASKFEGVESVTGASIDVGHYAYAWDCKNLDGTDARKGNYTMKVEVSHWPSYKHQLAAVPFEIGKKSTSTILEEGDFLPYIKIQYLKK